MKVRLEITNDDGTISNVEFTGNNWKKRLISFINFVVEDKSKESEPVSASEANYNIPPSNAQQYIQYSSQIPYSQQPQIIHMYPVPSQQFVQVPVGQQCAQPHQSSFYVYPQYSQPAVQQNVPHNSPVSHSNVDLNQQLHRVNKVKSDNKSPPQMYKNQPFQSMMTDTKLTITERLELFLKYEYPHVWFSSLNIQKHYERIYGPIKLSTVSTYLSRMFGKKLLERRGNRTQREYKYISDEGIELASNNVHMPNSTFI